MRRGYLILSLALLGCGTDGNNEAPTNNDAADGGRTDGGSEVRDMNDGSDAAILPDAATSTDMGGETSDMAIDQGPDEPDLAGTEADIAARLIYTNQRVFREDKFFARGGIATVELITPQELPADTRPEFFNDDGERCTFEMGSEWPEVPPEGNTWPVGPFMDGGAITLTAEGAPGPVVFSHLDTYYIRAEPGPVVIDNITHSSFFPPEYLPHGAATTISTAGGPAVGAFEVDGLNLAADYTVSAPDIETGNDVISTDSALEFTWDPPSPGDTMAVIVKDSFAFVKCRFDDDGAATVPAEAMALLIGGQFVRFTVQTWREHTVQQKVAAADDQIADVSFTSRHVQIGRFDSE